MYLMDQVKSESFIVKSTRLDIVHSPVRGEYLIAHIVIPDRRWFKTKTQDSYFTYKVKEGRYEFTWLTESWLAEEVSNYSVRSLNVGDLVNEYVYKTYGSKEYFKKRIQATESSWFKAYHQSFDDRDCEYIADNYSSIDIPEYSELIDEFFDIGVLRAYGMRYDGVAFLEIDETQLGNLVYFTSEEVELMFEQVAAFNQALDREISWKLAKSNFIRFTKDPEMQQIESVPKGNDSFWEGFTTKNKKNFS